MMCTRCGKATDYYYLAGPAVLCEDCACNSVSALADEGLFPFFDNVVPIQSGDGAVSETANEESVPTEMQAAVTEAVDACMERRQYMDPEKNLPEDSGAGGFFDYESSYPAQSD